MVFLFDFELNFVVNFILNMLGVHVVAFRLVCVHHTHSVVIIL